MGTKPVCRKLARPSRSRVHPVYVDESLPFLREPAGMRTSTQIRVSSAGDKSLLCPAFLVLFYPQQEVSKTVGFIVIFQASWLMLEATSSPASLFLFFFFFALKFCIFFLNEMHIRTQIYHLADCNSSRRNSKLRASFP